MVCGVCGLCLRDDGTRSLLMDEKVFTSTGPSSGGDPIDNQHLLKQRKVCTAVRHSYKSPNGCAFVFLILLCIFNLVPTCIFKFVLS